MRCYGIHMKTAEKWYHTDEKLSLHNIVTSYDSDFEAKEVIDYIKQIQLDAWKQGMLDAATIVDYASIDYIVKRSDFIRQEARNRTILT